MTTKMILYSYCAENITLEATIAACKDQLKGAIALLYSPSSCRFMRLENEKFKDSQDSVIEDCTDIFEVRVFNLTCELRWLNRIDGLGDAVLLSETQQTIHQFSENSETYAEVLQQQYLLWGEQTQARMSLGWQRLAEARIGKLDIPLDESLKKSQRVYLRTNEYLATIDEYGNFGVIEERLIKLEVA
jgi:CRISPR-associated protein (TIGR03984 family)